MRIYTFDGHHNQLINSELQNHPQRVYAKGPQPVGIEGYHGRDQVDDGKVVSYFRATIVNPPSVFPHCTRRRCDAVRPYLSVHRWN